MRGSYCEAGVDSIYNHISYAYWLARGLRYYTHPNNRMWGNFTNETRICCWLPNVERAVNANWIGICFKMRASCSCVEGRADARADVKPAKFW